MPPRGSGGVVLRAPGYGGMSLGGGASHWYRTRYSNPPRNRRSRHTHTLARTTSSASALVCLHHVSVGNPVPFTCFAAIKSGNYNTFPGLTLRNAMKHYPSSDATIKGHLKQTCQGLHSTNPKPTSSNRFAPLAMLDSQTSDEPDKDPSHKPPKFPPLTSSTFADFPPAKLYTNDTGRLPIQAHSGNQTITIASHSHCNAIHCSPYVNRSDKHQLAAYNESKGRQAGYHIFVSKNDPFPEHIGLVLSISQIMKYVMCSATEAKLGALYTTAKEMAPLFQTLIKMGWPKPHTPIQMDNSSAICITNFTIILQKTKSIDLCLWWLRCQ
jgi:hypothetical protein